MPNPTTINEDHSMTIPETIAKLRGLHISLDLGALHCSDYTNRPTGEEGVACDKRETFIVDPGHTLTDIARYFAELHNALPQLLDALEARESEKPKKTDEELIEVPLVNGGVAIIDQDSPAMEYKVKWRMDHYGYVVWNTSKTVNRIKKHISIKMHSIVLPPRRELVIDHINGNKLDNRRSNLRYATREENSFNSGASKNNKSGAKGVRRLKKFSNKPFTAQIKYKGRCMWLGSFATLEEASDAYQAAADKYFGEFKRAALAVVREANHE